MTVTPTIRAPVGSSRYVTATLVGRFARHALVADREWRVFAAFRRSFYCRSARGAVILAGPATLGAGPLQVLWPGSTPLEGRPPAVGMAVGVDLDGAGPVTGAALTLGLGHAREWRRPAPPGWEPSSLRRGLAWLATTASGRPSRNGLAHRAARHGGATDRSVGVPSGTTRVAHARHAVRLGPRRPQEAVVGAPPASVEGLRASAGA
jgi:hypothetical protein